MSVDVDYRWPFEPNPGGQAEFLADAVHRHVGLEGGLGSGKTFAGAWKGLALHEFNAFDDRGQPTYVRGAIVGDTFGNVKRFDVPAMEAAIRKAGLTPDIRFGSPPRIIVKEFGTRSQPSQILLASAAVPSAIAGWESGWMWCDEVARWKQGSPDDPMNDPLVQVRGRVRQPGSRHQQIVYTYTNEGDGTAIFRFFREVDNATKLPHPNRAWYRASTVENKKHVEEFLKDQLQTLPPDLAEQYIHGFAVNLKGRHAYSNFTQAVHVRAEALPIGGADLCLSLDFQRNPGMIGILGHYVKSADMFVIVHELHAARMDVLQLVAELRNWIGKMGGWKFNRLLVYGDATSHKTWEGTSESHYSILQQALQAAGLSRHYRHHVPSHNPFVSDRVNSVQMALLDVNGKSHLMIHPSCEYLISDFKAVKWDGLGVSLDKSNPQWTHPTDALGYFVHRRRPMLVRYGGRSSGPVVTSYEESE